MIKKSIVRVRGLVLLSFLLMIFAQGKSQSIQLTSPSQNQEFLLGQTIQLNASPIGVQAISPAYIQVNNTLTGYRKVKFGYSSTNIYSPLINVISGGNTHVSITLRNFGDNVDWSRIKFRPMASGNINLQPYVTAVGGIGDEWKTISIPLADFNGLVDFTQVAYIEFPYSSDAGNFNIAFSEIKFTGGSTPFLWFGDGKTDNKHDGTGGPGSLLATLVPASLPSVYVQKTEFFIDGNSVGEDFTLPYTIDYITADSGSHQAIAVMHLSDGNDYTSNPVNFIVNAPGSGSNILQNSLVAPLPNTVLSAPGSIVLQSSVTGLPSAASDFMQVSNQLSGFRKLKMGYSSANIYNPPNNVIAGGNTQLEITLKNNGGFIDWTKIRIRPMALGNLSLNSYINAVGGLTSEWKTISIPLSDFDSSIDFTQIAYLEFPYSADAGPFDISIKSIRFTGAPNDFNWFGDGKNNNAHNGNGGPGELVAVIHTASNTGDYIQKVEFFKNNTLLFTDLSFPYQHYVSGLEEGTYGFHSIAWSQTGLTSESNQVTVTVNPPPVMPSPLQLTFTSPANNTIIYAPTDLTLNLSVSGEVQSGPDYLKVINNQSGYRKLKMGYESYNIYGPPQNTTATGNNILQIELKDFGGNADWSKIRIRPSATGSLNLNAYMAAAVALSNGWKRISIPLSHFDPTIDFSNLQFFEFPYSAGASAFDIGIRLVKFTGGALPFVWFGEGKTNNAHDGFNGAGQLLATLIDGSVGVVNTSKIELFNNSTKVGEDTVAPWQFSFINAASVNYKYVARLTDSNGNISVSDTLFVSVQQNLPPNALVLTITFDAPPTFANVSKAPLRYNKDFAYSLTLDDGYRCAYTYAFPLLNGGQGIGTGSTYPGLYYTDGCGNDVSFKAASAWNTANGSGIDLHVNSTNYINWPELQTMLNSGWNVLNHSYQHAAGAGTNYQYQVVQNTDAVYNKTGVKTTQLVIPSGDANYIPVAYANGMYAIYANNSSFLGWPNGLLVNPAIPSTGFSLYKRQLYSELYNTSNITQHIDNVASMAVNGNKYWYNDFTHRVQPTPTNGSLAYATFEYYMNYVATTYGKTGSDRVWMAPLQEVYEYLRVRDLTTHTLSLYDNQLRIVINRDMLPVDFVKYAMSFNIESDANIISVSSNHPAEIQYRGNTAQKLLNLAWNNNAFKSADFIAEDGKVLTSDDLMVFPNPAKDILYVEIPDASSDVLVQLVNLMGRMVSEEKMNIDANSRIALNISTINRGVYFLKIIHEDKKTVRSGKVMIIR